MQCELRFSISFSARRRARDRASHRCATSVVVVGTPVATLLVFAVFIGALGAAVPALQAQQAVIAAPAGSQAAPSPKAETPPPAESSAESAAHTANSALPGNQHLSVSITNAFVNFQIDIRESTNFTTERKL